MSNLGICWLLCTAFFIHGSYAESSLCQGTEHQLVGGTGCKKYLECQDGVWYLQQCNIGLIFNPKALKCQSIAYFECPDKSTKCEEGATYAHPESKNVYFICLDGRISVRYCGAREVFDPAAGKCSLAATSAKCRGTEHQLVGGTGCKKYLECQSGAWYLKQCNIGLIFNPDALKCQSIAYFECPDKSTKCEEGATYAHPESKSVYFICLDGRISVRYCGAREVFDPAGGKCVRNSIDITAVNGGYLELRKKRSAVDTCKEGSRRRNGDSCKGYIECVGQKEVAKTCPDCTNYDEVSKACRINVVLPCGPGYSMPTPAATTEMSPTTSEVTTSSTTQPTSPATTQPTTPATTQPTSPATTQPTSPATTQPTSPATTQPTSPATSPEVTTPPTVTIPSPSPTGSTSSPVPDHTSVSPASSNDASSLPLSSSSLSPTGGCVEGKKISVKDADCKKYKECVKGELVQKSCGWGKKFDTIKNDCLLEIFNKIHCDK